MNRQYSQWYSLRMVMKLPASKASHQNTHDAQAPNPIFIGVAAVWFLFCVASFLRGRPIPFSIGQFAPLPSPAILTPYFFERAAENLLRVALFWTAAWRLGSWVREFLKSAEPTLAELILQELGLGAGALGLSVFALGVFGCLNGRLLIGILGALALAALPRLFSAAQNFDRGALVAAAPELVNEETALPLLFIAIVVLYQFLAAMGPTLFYDSLVYHLALPDLYLRAGAIVPTPMNALSGIPSGIEMLYLWMLPLGGLGSPCQVLHLSLGVLASLAIVSIGKRLGHAAAGVWAAAIFLSSPMVLFEMGRPGVELGTSFYLALALLALIVYNRRQDDRGLFLIGIFSGLVLGTKYQNVILLPAVAGYLLQRFGWRDGWRPTVKVWLVAVALAMPWGLKNIVYYRNPVYPFLGGTLFPPSAMIDLPALLSPARNVGDIFHHWNAFKDFARHPWSYAMPSEKSDAANVMSLFFVITLPFLLFLDLEDDTRRLILFAAILWLPMNLMTFIARYSIPTLVPLSLIAALALESFSRRYALARYAATAIVFALGALYAHNYADPQLWAVLSGRLDEKQFLSHSHPIYPMPPFLSFNWANEHLPRDAKILLVGEPRSFYLDRKSVTSSPCAVQPICFYSNASASGEDLYNRLKSEGITHVYINFANISLSKQVMKMSPQGLEALGEFWSRFLAEVYADRSRDPNDAHSSEIYRLLSTDEARRPHPSIENPFEARPRSAGG